MSIGSKRLTQLTLAGLLLSLAVTTAHANGLGFGPTIPELTLARDVRNNQVYMAPPIPYGTYAKYSTPHVDRLTLGHGLFGGLGLGHLGLGKGQGLGLGHLGHGGAGCSDCGGGLGLGHGGGLGLGHGGGFGLGHGGGLFSKFGLFDGCSTMNPCGSCGSCLSMPTIVSPQSMPVPTKVDPVPMPQMSVSSPQGIVSGPAHGNLLGHGLDGGLLKTGHGFGQGFGGHGLGGYGFGGHGGLGGHGIKSGHHGLGSGIHGLLSRFKFGVNPLLQHGPGVDYFVGPGGPVPLTPGYVPYVVPTRAPRDIFSFPPYADRPSYGY